MESSELDVSSETFNPLRCLYAADYRVTNKQPKVIYQNMAAFETALKNVGIWDVGKRPKGKVNQQPGTSKQCEGTKTTLVEEEKTQRRFQEHQMAIRTESKMKNKHTRNILGQMSQATGPLQALSIYISTGKRVHVMVRREKGIKGCIEGTLKMFDRHWNLLLIDVDECYRYRKYKYVEDNIVFPIPPEDCSHRLQQLGIVLPQQTVKSLDRKTVEIRRNIPQLFLRGEHVVLVRPVKPTNETENTSKPS